MKMQFRSFWDSKPRTKLLKIHLFQALPSGFCSPHSVPYFSSPCTAEPLRYFPFSSLSKSLETLSSNLLWLHGNLPIFWFLPLLFWIHSSICLPIVFFLYIMKIALFFFWDNFCIPFYTLQIHITQQSKRPKTKQGDVQSFLEGTWGREVVNTHLFFYFALVNTSMYMNLYIACIIHLNK